LRRQWSLCGREGSGFLSPSRRACEVGFRRFRGVETTFSTTPEVGKETEANGGHSGDRTLNRTRSRFDQTCPISLTQQSGAQVLGFTTGASGPSRNRSVRSGTQRSRAWRRADRTRDAYGHTRSDASGRDGSSLDRDRTLALSCSVVVWSASGHVVARVGTARTCVSGQLSGASGDHV
jgi:hypothetical protein